MSISKKQNIQIVSHDEKETIALGQKLSRLLMPGCIVCFSGDLGAGKTTLIKGISKGLNVSVNKVNSPTFVIMNIYDGKIPIYHFDLYRLDREEELRTIGFEEFFYGQGVALIEWANKLKNETPKEYLELDLSHKSEKQRIVKISPVGEKYVPIVKNLKQLLANGKKI